MYYKILMKNTVSQCTRYDEVSHVTPGPPSTINIVTAMSHSFTTKDDIKSSFSFNKCDNIQQKSICVTVNHRNIPRIPKSS
jgi:hypothetical protein